MKSTINSILFLLINFNIFVSVQINNYYAITIINIFINYILNPSRFQIVNFYIIYKTFIHFFILF